MFFIFIYLCRGFFIMHIPNAVGFFIWGNAFFKVVSKIFMRKLNKQVQNYQVFL